MYEEKQYYILSLWSLYGSGAIALYAVRGKKSLYDLAATLRRRHYLVSSSLLSLVFVCKLRSFPIGCISKQQHWMRMSIEALFLYSQVAHCLIS